MCLRPLHLLHLADEWTNVKGGMSTMNREMAIQFAKFLNVSVFFFVPKSANCSDKDKRAAKDHNVTIVEAKKLTGYEVPVDWLAFPPKDLVIDIVVGHSVVLGKQAQIITESHNCKWVQVIHTAPEELAMYKTDYGALTKGDKKQRDLLKLCKKADLVITIGPKLTEFYSRYFDLSEKIVFNLTPGIFTELSNLKKSDTNRKKFQILLFGRGDSEDFELKGFDIAAQAVAALNDKRYHLKFVGAPIGSEEMVVDKLLMQGLNRSQLTVKGFVKSRKKMEELLRASDIALIPSRIEGFGLTALEALSAGLPFLVSKNSGFGEALQEISPGSSFIVDSEDPKKWAEAIECARQKGSAAIQECQELRTLYAAKYDWETPCNEIVRIMRSMVDTDDPSTERGMFEYQTLSQTQLPKGPTKPVASSSLHTSSSETPTGHETPKQTFSQTAVTQPPVTEPRTSPRIQTSSTERLTVRQRVDSINRGQYVVEENWASQGARPKDYKSLSKSQTTTQQRGHDLSMKEQICEYQMPKQLLSQTAVTPPPVWSTKQASLSRFHTSSSERPTVRQRVDSINRGVNLAIDYGKPHIRDQVARPKESLSKSQTTKQQRGLFPPLRFLCQVGKRLKLPFRMKSQWRYHRVDMEPEKHLMQVAEENIVPGPHNKGAMGYIAQGTSSLAENVLLIFPVNYGRVSIKKEDLEKMYQDFPFLKSFFKNIKFDRRAARMHNLRLIVSYDEEGYLWYDLLWNRETQNRSNLQFLEELFPRKAVTPQPVINTELAPMSMLDTSSPERPIVREKDQCVATNLEGPEKNTVPHIRGVQWPRRPRFKRPKCRLKNMNSSCAGKTNQQKDEKVTICDQEMVHQNLDRRVKQRDKRFGFWLKRDGKFIADFDKLEILTSSLAMAPIIPQASHSEGIQGQTNFVAPIESAQTYEDQYHVMQRSELRLERQHFQAPRCTSKIQQTYSQPTAQILASSSAVAPIMPHASQREDIEGQTASSATTQTCEDKTPRYDAVRNSEHFKGPQCAPKIQHTYFPTTAQIPSSSSAMPQTSHCEGIEGQTTLVAATESAQTYEEQTLRYHAMQTVEHFQEPQCAPEIQQTYSQTTAQIPSSSSAMPQTSHCEGIEGQTILVAATEPAQTYEEQTLRYHAMQSLEHFQEPQCAPKIQQTYSQTTAQILSSSSAMPQISHCKGIEGQTTRVAATESAQTYEEQTLGFILIDTSEHSYESQCTPRIQQAYSQTTSTAKCTLL